MRALFFGTYDAEAHPRVGILERGVRDHGVEVLACNVPLGLSTAARVSMLRRPWLLPRLAMRLTRCWVTLTRRARRLPVPDVVVVGYLGHFDVRLARRLYRRTPIVLDHLIGASDTATDRGVQAGLRQRLLRRLDERALRAADLVLVDTDEHRAALPVEHRGKALVLPVGAPDRWFDAGEAAAARTSAAADVLRVVFFGLYTPLQGTPVIGRALSLLSEDAIDVTMIGAGQDLDETRALARGNPRVTWRSWVPPADLPALVADHHVCLGIFGSGEKAGRVVPNKIFQGAAAGCALITSDTPPQRRMLVDAAVFVPPGDAAALAAELRALAHDRGRLAQLRSAAHQLATGRFRPADVTAELLHRLESLVVAGDATPSATPAERSTRWASFRR